MAEAALVTIALAGGILAGWSVHRAAGALAWPIRVAAVVVAIAVAAGVAYAIALTILLLVVGFGP